MKTIAIILVGVAMLAPVRAQAPQTRPPDVSLTGPRFSNGLSNFDAIRR